MNKLNFTIQIVCLIFQTFGIAIGALTSNYWLVAWCAIWGYYALDQVFKEVDKCHILQKNEDQN